MADDPAFIRDLSTDGRILGLQMGMVIGKYIAHCRAWFRPLATWGVSLKLWRDICLMLRQSMKRRSWSQGVIWGSRETGGFAGLGENPKPRGFRGKWSSVRTSVPLSNGIPFATWFIFLLLNTTGNPWYYTCRLLFSAQAPKVKLTLSPGSGNKTPGFISLQMKYLLKFITSLPSGNLT